MQEEINNRSIAITVSASRLTARILAKAMLNTIAQMKAAKKRAKTAAADTLPSGKMSVKELSKRSGGGLESVEITDDNIKAFDPIARKYGITYSLAKVPDSELSQDGPSPKWTVFFRGKDSEVMTQAFKEFAAKTLEKSKDKPSVLDAIKEFGEKIQNKVRNREKVRERGEPER